MSAAGPPARPRWRLIVDGDRAGARTMAIDRAVLAGRAAGTSPPTLRLYGWERPTLTLGRFQDAASVDPAAAASHGVDVVRRPTGGRAVLHDDEVTYSVVASTADGVPRGVVASYRHFAVALAEAFGELGVAASIAGSTRGERASAACYLASTQADLVVGASKLSGSAQVWEGDAVLQHGSFAISRDAALEAELMRLPDDQRARLEEATVTIEQATGSRPSAAAVRRAIVGAFQRTLGIELVVGDLSAEELAASHDLDQRFRVSEV